MKKYIALLLFICIFSYSTIAQITACNDSLIMSIKGTWKLYPRQPMHKPVTKAEFDMATKNMEAYHQLLLEAYPQGIGCEPQVNMVNPNPAFYTPSVYSYYYYTAIYPYVCIKDKPVNITQTNTTLSVYVNAYDKFWTSTKFFINGQEVFYRQPKAGQWKGYDSYYSQEEPIVMLTRSNMLPYKPVTRKQYLDYMIHYFDSLYTSNANLYKNLADPTMKEQATNITTKKNEILKVYRKELEKSENKNLLDSAAIVKDIVNTSFFENTDIFIPEEKGGKVLLMINPAYFRKDLPKYIPQFMIARIQGGESGTVSERYFAKMMKGKFPFDKLQAMIDK
jgi:hypothetical protein